ncbi:hypothetical protein INR49_002495 [Caranx melampygus]|nr:hypothetical protein INR49_002495 [Caranx melampygus]
MNWFISFSVLKGVDSSSGIFITEETILSYILNAHFSFWSSLPREVTLRAMMNSLKSIVPSPLASNVRKTCSANLEASPYGKKLA